jgi:hypothetical protein
MTKTTTLPEKCRIPEQQEFGRLRLLLESWCGGLRGAAEYAEADVFWRGSAIRAWIGRTIRAAAFGFAFAVGSQHPLRGIAAEVKDWLVRVAALTCKTSDGLEQRCWAGKLFQFFVEAIAIFGFGE